MAKQTHLTLVERCTIESMLNNSESFKAIGRKLGRHCTTISKEVRGHILFKKQVALDILLMTVPTADTVTTQIYVLLRNVVLNLAGIVPTVIFTALTTLRNIVKNLALHLMCATVVLKG